MCIIQGMLWNFNPFVPNAPFLYPLKTSKNFSASENILETSDNFYDENIKFKVPVRYYRMMHIGY